MIIVTSGSKYIDIDAYAGCIAYSYLLNLKGIPSKAVSTAKLNKSITKELLKLDTKLDNYSCAEDDEFIIVDVSDKDFFDNIVLEDRVIEVIDHHVGFENYWKEKLEDNSKIEFIGSVVTIIYELYENDGLQDRITKDIAYLMMSAILDNTLNFKAKITTDRDINVYKKLQKIAGVNDDYASRYFLDCQQIIENDLKTSLKNDTKVGIISKKLPKIISQLTVWNKEEILNNKEIIYETLTEFGHEWILNLICLKEGKSYIMASDSVLLKNMKDLLIGRIKDGYLECQSVWLRKEIIKQANI